MCSVFFLLNCHTLVKELSLPYYLPMAGGRTDGFLAFPRVLEQSAPQKASSACHGLLLRQ